MTDTSPGPGWWLASDGNWYPPHLHPDQHAHQNGTLLEDARATTDDVVADDVVADEVGEDDVGADDVVADDVGADVTEDGPREVPYPPPAQLVPEREPIDWAKVAAEKAAR